MKLGRYTLLRRLAVGGMAELYRASRDDGSEVALKLVLPQHARDPGFVAMLMDEARLARELDHPGLVRVLDHGEVEGQAFLAMELVEGPSLAALIAAARRSGRALSPSLALYVARSLCEALRYLHGLRGADGAPLEVVHRDVTPGNVLVAASSGEVKLGDFGIAQHRLRQTRTRTGVIKGTVQYMAPEQVTGSGIDARTDLYGVGLILFELLTLHPFVEAERELDLLRIVEDPPWRAPSSLRPELGGELDALCQRALRRFPEERFPDAGSFLAAIERAEAELPSRTRPAELAALCAELAVAAEPAATADTVALAAARGQAGTQLSPAPARTSRLPALALAGGVAALVGLLAWRALREPAAFPPSVDAGARVTIVAPDARADQRRPGQEAGLAADAASLVDARRRKPGRPLPRPRLDAGAGVAAPRAAAERAALARRLQAARGAVQARGILLEDLGATLYVRLRRVETALGGEGEPAALAPEVAALERELGALKVTRSLVEAKLRRVDALLRKRGAASQPQREAAALALQDFMDGRYAEANRRLNAILGAL